MFHATFTPHPFISFARIQPLSFDDVEFAPPPERETCDDIEEMQQQLNNTPSTTTFQHVSLTYTLEDRTAQFNKPFMSLEDFKKAVACCDCTTTDATQACWQRQFSQEPTSSLHMLWRVFRRYVL